MKHDHRLGYAGALLAAALAVWMILGMGLQGRHDREPVPSRPGTSIPAFPQLEGSPSQPKPQVAKAPSRLVGQVVDAGGRGIPDAIVWDPKQPYEVTRSGADGHFEWSRINFDDLALAAVANGFLQASSDASVTPLIIVLQRGASLSGRVVDEAGRPLADAMVVAAPEWNRTAWPWFNGRYGAPSREHAHGGWGTSDALGEFRIDGLITGSTVSLVASKPGFVGRVAYNVAPVSPDPVEITLDRLWSLRLVIQDAETLEEVPVHRIDVTHPKECDLQFPAVLKILDAIRAGGESSDVTSGDVFHWTQRPGSATMDSASAVATVSAPGYDSHEERVELSTTGLTTRRVALRRKSGGIGVVRFLASLANDTQFTGPLEVLIGTEDHGALGLVPVEFQGGLPSRLVKLPEGRYRVKPRGSGWSPATKWLAPGGPSVILDVRRGVDVECKLRVIGNPVRLRVVDDTDQRVHGFDLGVTPEKGLVSGGMFRWDLNRIFDDKAPVDLNREADPVLWLPVGRCTISASLPGIGHAVGQVFADGTGDEVPVLVKLTPEPK